MTDDVHEIWSEDQLDRALAALHSDVDTDNVLLAKARRDLVAEPAAGLSTPDEPGWRRRPVWWLAAAVAVVAVVAGFLVVQTIPLGEKRPAASAAAAELNSTADRIVVPDPPLGLGQYHYVATHAWYLSTANLTDKAGNQTASLTMFAEQITETWMPQDPEEECLIRSGTTGNYKWVTGSDAEAKAAGLDRPTAQTEDRRERCLAHPGSWQQPNPEWLAELPREPAKLYARLREATKGHGPDPDLEVLVYMADTLRGGQVPTDLRGAMYRALALDPALEITDRAANLDGRVGVAYGVNRSGTRREMIIDPGTGQFIGERETTTAAMDDIPAGTVMSSTSVTTGVAPAIGAKPAG